MINSVIRRPVLCIINIGHQENMNSLSDLDYFIIPINTNVPSELLTQFDETNPDCIILVFSHPPAKTNELFDDFDRIRRYCELRHIPLIAMAENLELELKVALLADAFLRPSEQSELKLQVNKLVERRGRILDQILIDPLTDVFNYRYLHREVQIQLDVMKRFFEPFTLVYVDIDAPSPHSHVRRKQTQAVIAFMKKSIRPTDCFAHHADGGFVIVLPKTVKEDAVKLMKRLIHMFPESDFNFTAGKQQVTFSAKIREFIDASIPAEQCLTRMPFTEEEPQDRRNTVLEAVDPTQSEVRKLMVAIIDDDRLVREMLKHQLADIGGDQYDVEVRTFADGELFFGDPWHRQNEQYIVIIDRIIPKMEGLEVLHKIRSSYSRHSYQCIIVSSRGSEADITLAIQNGANDYLVKPFSLKELRARINRLIGVK